MTKNRSYETKRLNIKVKGSFYSERRLIKMSSIKGVTTQTQFRTKLCKIFKHSYFDFEFYERLQTGIIIFSSNFLKTVAEEALKEEIKTNKWCRINENYRKPKDVFACKDSYVFIMIIRADSFWMHSNIFIHI